MVVAAGLAAAAHSLFKPKQASKPATHCFVWIHFSLTRCAFLHHSPPPPSHRHHQRIRWMLLDGRTPPFVRSLARSFVRSLVRCSWWRCARCSFGNVRSVFLSVFRCFGVSVFRCFGVSSFRCSLFRCFVVSLFVVRCSLFVVAVHSA